MNLGYKIKKLRELKNLSQEYVAQELGISQSAYSLIECGKTNVTEDKLKKIAEILDVSPEDIKAFNGYVYFNHSPQSGYYNTYHNQNNITEQLLQTLLEEIQQSREERKLMMDLIKIWIETK